MRGSVAPSIALGVASEITFLREFIERQIEQLIKASLIKKGLFKIRRREHR